MSCGKGSLNGKKTIKLSREEISEMMANQKFECASIDGGACPEGIARVFILNIKSPADSSVCSGFLNGTNQLVTNNHCLSTLEECKNTFISVYNGGSFESAKCKGIIRTEVDNEKLNLKGIDYTVLELDQEITKTIPLSLSETLPVQNDVLTAWVVDQIDNRHARITELSCTFVGVNHSMELKSCPAIPGNSGSPIVNSSGEVVAVLWGTTVKENINEATPLSERRALGDYGLATELKHFRDNLKI